MVDMSRREFMIAGSTSLLALDGGVTKQVDSSRSSDQYEFQGVADLIGPAAAKPEPGDPFFDDKIAYAYRYQETDREQYEWFITEDDANWTNLSMQLKDYSTPYDALKVANQLTQFAIDPSKGLTRRRLTWHSNNTRFDKSFYSENDADGTIDISTGATAANTANIHTSITGQYVSQSLAQPGVGLDIDEKNVEYASDGTVSLSHGTVSPGVGWHDNSVGGWGIGAEGGPVQTYLGIRYAEDGAYAELISNGERIGDSPVPQSEWNLDTMDGSGDADNPSGQQLRPDNGYVYQFPYTWYGHGALYVGISSAQTDDELLFHKFTVPETSFDRPNLPVTAIVDDEGVASDLTAQIGGLQYALYGSNLDTGGGEKRGLAITRNGFSVSTAASYTNNSVDPVAEPGVPVAAFQREPNIVDIAVRLDTVTAEVNGNLWLFAWDEYDAATALTDANFRNPNESVHPDDETKLKVDTAATSYTPSVAVTRGIDYLSTQKNNASLQQVATDDRLPIECTRVITAATRDSNTTVTLNPAQIRVIEGY